MDDLTLSRAGDDIPRSWCRTRWEASPSAGALVLVLGAMVFERVRVGNGQDPVHPRAVTAGSGRRPLLCLAVAVAVGVVVLFAVSALTSWGIALASRADGVAGAR